MYGEVQIDKNSIISWDGKAFTVEDGTAVYVTFFNLNDAITRKSL